MNTERIIEAGKKIGDFIVDYIPGLGSGVFIKDFKPENTLSERFKDTSLREDVKSIKYYIEGIALPLEECVSILSLSQQDPLAAALIYGSAKTAKKLLRKYVQ